MFVRSSLRLGTFAALIALPHAREARVQDSPVALQGTIDLTIGSAEETRDDYIFGYITSTALHDDGRILAADASTNNVRVFGPDGRHQLTFGRAGAGPGDLRNPCCMVFAPDGQLWIRDVRNRRFSIFNLDNSSATFVRTIPSHVTSPRPLPDRTSWDGQGHIIDLGQMPNGYLQRAFLDSTGRLVRLDTLKPPPAESLAVKEVRRQIEGGFSVEYFYQPHGPDALRAHGPRGEVAEAVSSNYAVSWFDASRRRIVLIRRTVSPPALSARERAEANKELDDATRDARVSRSVLPFDVPTHKPALRSLGFDLDERLWIERTVADGQPREADVYERDGRRVAIMRWPGHVSLSHRTVKGRTAIGVAVDSLGTNTIVRLRFDRAPRSN